LEECATPKEAQRAAVPWLCGQPSRAYLAAPKAER
jgi:hypothetical protein